MLVTTLSKREKISFERALEFIQRFGYSVHRRLKRRRGDKYPVYIYQDPPPKGMEKHYELEEWVGEEQYNILYEAHKGSRDKVTRIEPEVTKSGKTESETEELSEEHPEVKALKKKLVETREQMEQQIAGLKVAEATIRSLKGRVKALEPYPQRYESERAKAEFVHDLLNTCASEYFKARGEERKAERILRRDDYEGLAPDDFKPFFAGIGRRAGERENYIGMVLCLLAGKSVELSKKDDGTKVFKFEVPTFDGGRFSWSRCRNVTVTLNPDGKVVMEKGNIVSDEGSLRLTKFMEKEVETIGRNPYELLVEERREKEKLIKQLGMSNQFFDALMKALSELGICAGDTLDAEEIASRIGELKTNLEHACLLINDLLWERYETSEEFRLGLPKVFTQFHSIEDKVLKMNFVVYPDRTLKGIGEDEAEILRAKIETERA